MPTEVLDLEALKKERASLKGFLFGYSYGLTEEKTSPEAEALRKRFQEVSELLRPKAKA